ncbi:MAG: right-handed parallel beta-helix repeat-containing protein, partial [Desulfobacterales bacterium]|nr:right-handed parallel beta-helix repeat-containing protein [Desulfobacterales bacterium]
LKEKEPGVYIGAYRVRRKDRLPHGRIIGYLRAKSGTGSQWVDTLGPVKIGEPTVLPPKIAKNTVLTAAKSPYLVEDALLVLPGAKLTIQPGTVIWFRNLGLIVKGELRVNGTEAAPVRLASLGAGSWKGVFIDKTRNGSQISYCRISDAEFGLRATEAAVNVQNCLFQNNVWGIVLEQSQAQIQSTLVRTSGKIGIAARKADIVVEHSVITENGAGGFILEKSKARIEQNNIVNNGNWAIKVADTKSKVKAKHNWWGVEDPEQTEIVGQFKIQPVLEKPIDFKIDS